MTPATFGDTLVGGVAGGLLYALLALPFAILLALGRVLNLAHGEMLVLGGYVGYTALRAWSPPALALPVIAAVALAPLGALGHALLARVRAPVELNSLALTFGLSLLLQNGAAALWSADYRLLPPPGGARILGLPPERAGAAALAVVVFWALHVFLTRTRLGTAVRATSRDAETAALMAVDTGRLARGAFAAAGALAGAGGAVFAAIHYLHPAAGVELTLLAITVAILGGIGRLGGLLAAGVVLGLTEAFTFALLGARWREPVLMLVLLGALLARAQGPAGARAPG